VAGAPRNRGRTTGRPAGPDEATARKDAVASCSIATVIFIAAAFVGNALIEKWHVSPGTLAISGGIILFLVAMPLILPGVPVQPAPPPHHLRLSSRSG
jgi:small neutral amino acid transporter SnatA (MarC family)